MCERTSRETFVPDCSTWRITPSWAFQRFLSEGVETERIAYAFDNRRFAGAPTANQHIQVFVEVHCGVAQKPSFPSHGEELGMGFGFLITVQTNPGGWVEKRLPERLDRDSGHLDEAGGAFPSSGRPGR